MMISGVIKQITSTIKENYIVSIYAIVSVWTVIGPLPSLPSIVVYAVPLIYSLYCLLKPHKTYMLILAMLLYIPFELLVAQPSGVFKSWSRYVLFASVIINVSPLFQSEKHRRNRILILRIVLWACVFIGVGSFFARFLGINYMEVYNSTFAFQTGLFGGFAKHSMMLGPIAGISAIYLLGKAFETKQKIFWILMVLSVFSVFFSASRAALMATIAGLAISLYRLSGTTSKFLKFSLVGLVLASSTFSIWGSALDNVIEKNKGNSSSLNMDSRQIYWDARMDEFYSSPVIGVGFCAADETAIGVDIATGIIESGSSWIIVFSMLGIVGACIVIPIFIKAFRSVFRERDFQSAVVCGVLCLFFVHMFAEGYVFAGGSFLAFMLWLFVGIAIDNNYKSNNEVSIFQ